MRAWSDAVAGESLDPSGGTPSLKGCYPGCTRERTLVRLPPSQLIIGLPYQSVLPGEDARFESQILLA